MTLSDDAFFEVASSPGSNSALTGLTTIASSSDWLTLEDDATVTTSGALTNNGGIYLENGGSLTVGGALNTDDVLYMDYYCRYTGGSTLTVNGTLTNKGSFYVGNLSLEHDETITATSFVNDGFVDVYGNSTVTVNFNTPVTNDDFFAVFDEAQVHVTSISNGAVGQGTTESTESGRERCST